MSKVHHHHHQLLTPRFLEFGIFDRRTKNDMILDTKYILIKFFLQILLNETIYINENTQEN